MFGNHKCAYWWCDKYSSRVWCLVLVSPLWHLAPAFFPFVINDHQLSCNLSCPIHYPWLVTCRTAVHIDMNSSVNKVFSCKSALFKFPCWFTFLLRFYTPYVRCGYVVKFPIVWHAWPCETVSSATHGNFLFTVSIFRQPKAACCNSLR